MIDKFYLLIFALYAIPFIVIFATPGRRSFFVITGLMAAVWSFFWLDLARVPSSGQNLDYILALFAVITMGVGAVVGAVAKGVILAKDWSLVSYRSLATAILTFLAAPLSVVAATSYDEWKRRPPSRDCVARLSFDMLIAASPISIPNWPLVMVSTGNEHFSSSSPQGLRDICKRAASDVRNIDSVTFFFNSVTFRPFEGDVKTWAERKCQIASDELIAAFVCNERPIEQLSIYADANFARRTTSFGRIASHVAFAQAKSEGRYTGSEGRRHSRSSEYPDGTWAFDDGTVFKCYNSANGYPSCMGDVDLSSRRLAKVIFNAWHGDIESAQSVARSAVLKLSKELLASSSSH